MSEVKNILLVFGHENSKTSFNAAMKDVAIETLKELGLNVKVSCLSDMNFQCLSRKDFQGELSKPEDFHWDYEIAVANTNGTVSDEIKQEQEKVTWADIIIFQYPIHGMGFPAVVASWIDKVLSENFAYTDTAYNDEGLLKGKRVLLSMTFGGPEGAYTNKGMLGDINVFLYTMMAQVHYVGLSLLKPQICYNVIPRTTEQNTQYLDQWRQRLKGLDKEHVLTDVTLPDSCFDKKSGEMTADCLKKYEANDYGPTVGQNLGKKLPSIV